ncbi:MAG TPA: DUF6496 domain-containing protein [Planctomycetaceae bacterium]|jgi:hypothetical protein|nr:DUF6496 domain-containing protein [Planctomycetaceae bacterium]
MQIRRRGRAKKEVCGQISARKLPMAKYGAKAKSEVGRAMHRKKKGTLKSGKSHKSVKTRKQAIAIGLSKARKKGAKVPSKRKSG